MTTRRHLAIPELGPDPSQLTECSRSGYLNSSQTPQPIVGLGEWGKNAVSPKAKSKNPLFMGPWRVVPPHEPASGDLSPRRMSYSGSTVRTRPVSLVS